MKAQTYLLIARNSFHFGLRGVGIEAASVTGHADTLWSAFCLGLLELVGTDGLEQFIAAYASEDPPMLITSAFPFAPERTGSGDGWEPPEKPVRGDVVRFYPRPLSFPPGIEDLPENRKEIKHIAYVSETVFTGWIAGQDLSLHLDKDRRPLAVQAGKAWLSADEWARLEGWTDEETETISLWDSGDVPRVAVDRVSSASQVYQAGRITFVRGGGLWIAVRWGADWQEPGEVVLDMLGDSGLGGERSAGHGQFRLVPLGEETYGDPAPGGLFVNLALYWPPNPDAAQAVLGDDRARYSLEIRRGYMASRRIAYPVTGGRFVGAALRRKTARMAGEGSLLVAGGGAPWGGLADVTPELRDGDGRFLGTFDEAGGHRVLRYGYAFPATYGGAA